MRSAPPFCRLPLDSNIFPSLLVLAHLILLHADSAAISLILPSPAFQPLDLEGVVGSGRSEGGEAAEGREGSVSKRIRGAMAVLANWREEWLRLRRERLERWRGQGMGT